MKKYKLTPSQVAYAIEHLNSSQYELSRLTQEKYDILIISYNKYVKRMQDMEDSFKRRYELLMQEQRDLEEAAKNDEKIYKNIPYVRNI